MVKKMVRDALGDAVPQTLNDDGTYTVMANGDTTGVDFGKHKLLRDALGDPLPYQYFDVEQGEFVSGNLGGEVDEEVIENINTQLNTKRNKTDLITMNDIAQDVKTAMTGGSVPFVDVGTVNRLNLLNEAITPYKTSFLSEDVVNVSPINASNFTWEGNQPTSIKFDGEGFTVTATLQTGLFFKATNVEIGKRYTVSVFGENILNVRVYSSNKSSFTNAPKNSEGYFTVPFTPTESVLYLRLWIDNNTSAVCHHAGIYKGIEYKPSYKLKQNILVDTENIKPNSIGIEKCNFIKPSKNLFDKTKCTDGYMVNFTTISVNNGHTTSDYFEVEGDTDYVANTQINCSFFDESKGYVSAYNNAIAGTVMRSPVNAKYARISLASWGTNPNIKNTAQFEKGTVPTSYQSFELGTLDTSKVIVSDGSDKPPTNPIKWVSYGDSITQANNWQPKVASYHSLQHVNKGIGGVTVANNTGQPDNASNTGNYFCNINRINDIPTDTNLITIFGGTNDTGQSIPIGDLTYPFVSTTFKGGLALTITRIQAHIPNAKIVLLTTLSGRGTTAGQNMTSPVINNLGLSTEDYAKAIKEVGNSFSIPVIDVFGETGINQFNRATYITDTVHTNQLGGDKIAEVVIGGLKRILN